MNSRPWRGLKDMLSVHSSDTTRIAYEDRGRGRLGVAVRDLVRRGARARGRQPRARGRQARALRAPFIVDDSRAPLTPGIVPDIQQMVADGRRSAAVKAFMREVGVPGVMVTVMPAVPGWSKMKGIAHTVPYDLTIVADNQVGDTLPADRWTGVTMTTLVMVGGKSPTFCHNGTRQLAYRLPDAEHRVVDGQTHMVRPRAVAPLLRAFLGAEQGVGAG